MRMKKTGRAYFVERPRVLEDLSVPHLIEQERRYRIVKTVFDDIFGIYSFFVFSVTMAATALARVFMQIYVGGGFTIFA